MSAPGQASWRRIDSVDLLRGVIMIVMALDHTRDYFGDAAASPTNLATASAALFLTRWITNFCAPVFFLLTGTGAYLAGRRRGRSGLARYLLTRGIWLIAFELTLMRFLWEFNVDYHTVVLSVIWALGWAMVVLSALVYLPIRYVWTIGAILIVGHDAFDSVNAASLGSLRPLWNVLHLPGVLWTRPGYMIFVAYPLVPWIGVTAVGYGIGALYEWPAERRKRTLTTVGLGMIAAFFVLRGVNVYGDPSAWSRQPSTLFTVLSFINTTKYPPSLLFLLMTLGPALVALRVFDRVTPALLQPVVVYGRVPFFYYAMHVLVLHLVAVVVMLARYGSAHWAVESPTIAQYPTAQPPGWPFGLPVVYLIWACVVVALYPLCRWYAELRRRRTDLWMLSYL